MTTFEIWFRHGASERVPAFALLDEDYAWAGELDAANRKDLIVKVETLSPEQSPLYGHRAFRVGDVVRDEHGTFWVLAPLGVFAQVEAFMDSTDHMDDSPPT